MHAAVEIDVLILSFRWFFGWLTSFPIYTRYGKFEFEPICFTETKPQPHVCTTIPSIEVDWGVGRRQKINLTCS